MAPVATFKMHRCMFYLFLCIFVHLISSAPIKDDSLKDCGLPDCMELDGRTTSNIKVTANANGKNRIFIFCYRGETQNWLKLWTNPKLSIIKTSEDQEISMYLGKNVTEVQSSLREDTGTTWWKYFISSQTMSIKEDVSLNAFNISCIGISSLKQYSVEFKVKNPEFWFIAYVSAGIILFFWAPVWSRNVLIHYSAGVSVGVLASILLLAYILQRFLPEKLKSMAHATVLIGGSISLFVLKYMSTKIHDLLKDYWQYVLGYTLITGLISFALVYRYGPIKDNKSLNLLQWLLQIIGLALIYNGTQITEASVAIIILVISIYFFPHHYFSRHINYIRYRYFPVKRRFLTEDEYLEMKERETEKALDELREYCKSPQCDSWKVISRIKSPSRFASFVEGEDHLSDDEFYNHNVYSTTLPSDDQDEDDMSEIEYRLTSP